MKEGPSECIIHVQHPGRLLGDGAYGQRCNIDGSHCDVMIEADQFILLKATCLLLNQLGPIKLLIDPLEQKAK